MTKAIRPIDWTRPTVTYPGGYLGQMLYHGENCLIIATLVPPGVDGPARHVHPGSDQIYFIVEGEITVDLDGRNERAPSNSVVFIPSQTPHHSWNGTAQPEVHLEFIAPRTIPWEPVAVACPDEPDSGERGYVRVADETVLSGKSLWAGGDMTVDWLVSAETGARHAALYLAELRPGPGPPAAQVHECDQYYFVIEGTLTFELGLETSRVGPNTLLVVAAGVVHRYWNATESLERHVVALASTPERVQAAGVFGRPVELRALTQGAYDLCARRDGS